MSAPILHGLYSLVTAHQVDVARARALPDEAHASFGRTLEWLTTPSAPGWSALVTLTGSTSNLLLVHFRATFDELSDIEHRLAQEPLWNAVTTTFAFVSVAEVALYDLGVALEAETAERGGQRGDAQYQEALDERLAAERAIPHVARRLSPALPADKPCVCFYPMSKRRQSPHNWYTLPLAERARLMHAHGSTGRRYRGRIAQIVTGATGLADWEWGVTLFAADPLDIKSIVTDMRYDEASADYAEFGPFFIGLRTDPARWLATIGAGGSR